VERAWIQCIQPIKLGGLSLSYPSHIAHGAFIASSLMALKFWDENKLADNFHLSPMFQSLADLGTHLGSTSEACLALAHSHDLINYITLEPQSLQQHWWVQYSELNSTITFAKSCCQRNMLEIGYLVFPVAS